MNRDNADRAALVIGLILIAILTWAAMRNEPREVTLTIRFQLPDKRAAHVIDVPGQNQKEL